jgi:MFS family permease
VSGQVLNARWPLICFAALGNFWGAWAALVPDMKIQVGASDGELGIALLFAGVGAIPMMLVTGRIWRRAGWTLLPAAGLFFAVTILGPILATTPLMLGMALLFAGAGSGALDVSMNAAVSDVEADSGGRLMFGAHALFSLGVLVSAVATGFAREVGAEPAHVLTVVSIITATIALGTVQSARSASRVHADAPHPEADPEGSSRAVSAIAVLAALCAMAFLVEDAIQNWSALHLERELGAGPALGGAAPAIFATAMFIGRSLGQRLGARFTERGLLSGGALAAAIGTALLALAPAPAVAFFGLALAGAGISLVAPALFARAGRMTDPAGRGAAIARVTALGYSGFVIGPGLVGVIAQLTDLRTAIASLSLLALLLAISGAYVMHNADRAGTFEDGEELLKTGRA